MKRPTSELTRESAHIYFADALVRRAGPVEVSVRVGRRGFLSLALFTAGVVAGMLWFYAAHAKSLAEHPEVAAVVVLVVPPVLTTFAVRPGEHSLAARMLSGVRLGLMVDGLLAAAAAVSFARALPFGWRDAGAACHYYAVAATAVAGILLVSWLLALDATEDARRATRRFLRSYRLFRWAGIALAGAATGLVASFSDATGLHSVEHWARLGILLFFALGASWISTFWDVNDQQLDRLRHRQLAAGVLGLISLALVFAGPISAGYDLGLVHWREVRIPLLVGLAAAVFVLVSIEPLRRLGIPRPIAEGEEDLIIDWQDRDEGEVPQPTQTKADEA